MTIDQIILILAASLLALLLIALVMAPVVGLIWAGLAHIKQKSTEKFEQRDN